MNQKKLGMAWYKFLIYFALIAGAVVNFAYSINYFTGGIYLIQSNSKVSAEVAYATYGALQVLDIIYGLFLLILAVLAIVLQIKLVNYKPDVLKYIWIVFLLSAVLPFVYGVFFAVITEQPLGLKPPLSLIFGILFWFLNDRYFVKRAHLFGIKFKFKKPSSYVTCPRCDTETPGGSKFCQRCGLSLVEEDPKAVAKEDQPVVCPVCDCKLPSDSKFCAVCGSPIGGAMPSPNRNTSEKEKYLPALSWADEQITSHPSDVFGKDFFVQKPVDDASPVAAKANTVTEITYMGVDLFYIENLGWNFAFGQNEYWFPTLQAAKSAITEFTQNIIPKHCANSTPRPEATKE
jgi:hypothetical protein